ncbi:MAG TPA: phosphate acetyltransferase [Lentisphaeria bacterium]|nr:phosphate acetyltransferase [Lentisphaeria bacterium]HQL88106.1 phosphate acetyltransferase [Lentisphaeria bacterium]
MAGLMQKLFPKAAAAGLTLILPEGQDPRVMQAAKLVAERKTAKVKILATPAEAEQAAKGVCFQGLDVEIIDWTKSPLFDRLANTLFERRKSKGLTEAQARDMTANRLYFANLMLNQGLVDGLVAGSIASTPDMLRSAFHCVGTAKGIKLASSCFVMDLKTPAPAGDETLIFADCGVNPNPSAEELVDIAIATISTYKALIGDKPRLAFLSYSTKGSAKGDLVDKMATAAELTKARVAELGLDALVDGELQADAALVPAVATSKAPGSSLQGKANILIFPDLNCGNICYKITQRLAGADAYGPIMQGVAKPINDLSRGCSVEDIVGVAAITACQAIVK